MPAKNRMNRDPLESHARHLPAQRRADRQQKRVPIARLPHHHCAKQHKEQRESDDYLQRAAQRSPAITPAPITKAMMTVLIAVNRIPIVNNDAATIMI